MSDTPSSMGGTWFPWTWPVWPWPLWLSLAPHQLFQPINPGWTFGNVFVTAQNSSAPQTELEILSTESYGRQIGKLLDAVCELMEEKDVNHKSAFEDVIQLKMRVDKVKKEAAKWRTDQIKSDLELLRKTDIQTFNETIDALRTMLSRTRRSEPT